MTNCCLHTSHFWEKVAHSVDVLLRGSCSKYIQYITSLSNIIHSLIHILQLLFKNLPGVYDQDITILTSAPCLYRMKIAINCNMH